MDGNESDKKKHKNLYVPSLTTQKLIQIAHKNTIFSTHFGSNTQQQQQNKHQNEKKTLL